MQKIAIAGMGVVSAVGHRAAALAEAVREKRTAVGPVTGFDPGDLERTPAAEIVEFCVEDFIETKKSYLDRASELALAALAMARSEAGVEIAEGNAGRCGLSFGTHYGNVTTAEAFFAKLEAKGPRFAPPFLFPHVYANTTDSLLAIEHGLRGFNANFCGSRTAGLEAIAYACYVLNRGRADLMFAGGADAFGEVLFRGAASAARPSVLGEGAAIFALMRPDTAADRAQAFIAGASVAGTVEEAASRAQAQAGTLSVGITVSADPEADGTALYDSIGDTAAAAGPLALALAVEKSREKNVSALVTCQGRSGGAVALVITGKA